MDFTKRDTRAVEIGRELQLRDQSTGELIFDDKTGEPCIVLVRSLASRSVQAELKAEQRAKAARARGAKSKEEEARALEDLHQELIKSALRLITGFQNIEWGDEPATVEHAPKILDCTFISLKHLLADEEAREKSWLKPSFAQQVLEFAADEGNFLGESAAA